MVTSGASSPLVWWGHLRSGGCCHGLRHFIRRTRSSTCASRPTTTEWIWPARDSTSQSALVTGHGEAQMQRGLMSTPLSVACAPGIAKRLKRPSDVAEQTLLRSYRADEWPLWFAAAGAECPPIAGPIFDTSISMAEAAAQGLGIALLPVAMFDYQLSLRRLVSPFDIEVSTGEYWLTSLSRAPKPTPCALSGSGSRMPRRTHDCRAAIAESVQPTLLRQSDPLQFHFVKTRFGFARWSRRVKTAKTPASVSAPSP